MDKTLYRLNADCQEAILELTIEQAAEFQVLADRTDAVHLEPIEVTPNVDKSRALALLTKLVESPAHKKFNALRTLSRYIEGLER